MIESTQDIPNFPSIFQPYLVVTQTIPIGEELIVQYTGPKAKEFFNSKTKELFSSMVKT